MNNLSIELKDKLVSEGASLVGYADLSGMPPDIRKNMPFGVSIVVALNPVIISGIHNEPTKEYYAEYERVNDILDELSQSATRYLSDRGYSAEQLAVTSVGIDRNTLSTRLPHKTTATRAGLGWIGKTALLVTKQFGSAVRITTVLTDADLSVGIPIDASLCGTCTKCVDVCPAHASTGENWNITLYRDSFFNAFACMKTARELAKSQLGINNTICGICIAICPWTQRYLKRKMII